MNGQPHSPAIEPSPALNARVSKRLSPGQNGTKRLQAEYETTLVSVRYRQDGRTRYTTVELVIDAHPPLPRVPWLKDFIAVAIGYQELEMRAQAKQSGARWDAARRL